MSENEEASASSSETLTWSTVEGDVFDERPSEAFPAVLTASQSTMQELSVIGEISSEIPQSPSLPAIHVADVKLKVKTSKQQQPSSPELAAEQGIHQRKLQMLLQLIGEFQDFFSTHHSSGKEELTAGRRTQLERRLDEIRALCSVFERMKMNLPDEVERAKYEKTFYDRYNAAIQPAQRALHPTIETADETSTVATTSSQAVQPSPECEMNLDVFERFARAIDALKKLPRTDEVRKQVEALQKDYIETLIGLEDVRYVKATKHIREEIRKLSHVSEL